jgi:hypothetical protein
VHPSIHPPVRQSVNCACCFSMFHHARVETTRHPPPAVHRSPLDVETSHATPRQATRGCLRVRTRLPGALGLHPIPQRYWRHVGCVGLRCVGNGCVCVAARVCTCICTCGYPFGICMRRSGATREVLLFRDAGSGVTGRMPRGCGTGEERTMVLMFKGWIVTITSMSCATNGIRITGIVLQRK